VVNPILIAPGDRDIIDELLSNTNSGISVFSPEEFAKQIKQLVFFMGKPKGHAGKQK